MLRKSVFLVVKFFVLFLLIIYFNRDVYSQLNVNTAMTPAQLVQNVLLGGGVTVSNITYTGGVNSMASFTNGSTTNLGLNNGIILSTGIVTQIPNPATYFMSQNLGLAGDPDLQVINYGGQTYDACILQFDFVPLSDTVKFRYVFGSEEYPNYVCSHFNDVFAFFLTGQNPSGGNYTNYNLALIPGTSVPVSVNSVNNGNAGSGYPTSGCTSLAYSSYYVDNAAINGTTIAFGGFTTPLTAVCHVVPCQTYHIKIAVGEGFNGLYDSGVFLEANSFTSNTYNVNIHYTNSAFGNNAVEGCSQGLFSFILSSPAASPYTINYAISGTATNGIDYNSIPSSITIPAGQDSAGVYINPIFDGIAEGTQSVIITYTNGCLVQSDTIFIMDNSLLNVSISNDTTICTGNSASLTVTANNGMPPYSYTWSNGSSLSNISVSPASTTIYTVTVSDNCEQTATENVIVSIGSLSAVATSTSSTCNLSNGSVTASPVGTCTAGFTYQWNTTPSSSSQTVLNLPAGTYTVTISCSGCSTTASAIISSIPGPTVINGAITNSHCGQADGSIAITVNGGSLPYSYAWNTSPLQTTQNAQNIPAGNYIVTVTDVNNCSATSTAVITDIPGPLVTIDTVINCDCGLTNGAVEISVSGGIQPYSYSWNTVPAQTSEDIQNIPAGNYSVTVTDVNGCTATESEVVPQAGGPVLSVSSTNEMCLHSNGTSTVVATLGTGTYTYLWSTSPNQTSATATGLTAGTYTVTVDDGNCSTTASVIVNNSPGPNGYISIHPSITTLMEGPVEFSGSSNGSIISWFWEFGDGAVADGQSTAHQYGSLGTYVVTLVITDNNGCIDTVTDTVKVKDIFTLYIPNSFTPNGDGRNDLFLPYGLNIDPDKYEMMIFDRWGQLLFDTKEWGVGWNGTLNNHGTKSDVIMDVYVYKIIAKPNDGGKLKEYYGRVLLFP